MIQNIIILGGSLIIVTPIYCLIDICFENLLNIGELVEGLSHNPSWLDGYHYHMILPFFSTLVVQKDDGRLFYETKVLIVKDSKGSNESPAAMTSHSKHIQFMIKLVKHLMNTFQAYIFHNKYRLRVLEFYYKELDATIPIGRLYVNLYDSSHIGLDVHKSDKGFAGIHESYSELDVSSLTHFQCNVYWFYLSLYYHIFIVKDLYVRYYPHIDESNIVLSNIDHIIDINPFINYTFVKVPSLNYLLSWRLYIKSIITRLTILNIKLLSQLYLIYKIISNYIKIVHLAAREWFATKDRVLKLILFIIAIHLIAVLLVAEMPDIRFFTLLPLSYKSLIDSYLFTLRDNKNSLSPFNKITNKALESFDITEIETKNTVTKQYKITQTNPISLIDITKLPFNSRTPPP